MDDKFRARKRVGHAAEEQLRWLLNLCQHESDILEAGDKAVERTIAKVARFAGASSVDAGARSEDRAEKLQDFATAVFEGIGFLLKGEAWVLWFRAKFKKAIRRGPNGRIETSYPTGDFWSAACWRAQEFVAETFNLIGECRRDGCGAFFVVNKRQRYCSVRCSRIEASAKWRRKNPDKARLLRHETYKRKVAREKGADAAERVRRRVAKDDYTR